MLRERKFQSSRNQHCHGGSDPFLDLSLGNHGSLEVGVLRRMASRILSSNRAVILLCHKNRTSSLIAFILNVGIRLGVQRLDRIATKGISEVSRK